MADGSLIFDTKISTKGFNDGVNGLKGQANSLTGTLMKLGSTIALAFGVRQIINFSKQAINLASDLQEVQNVVDTTFGEMSYKLEEFAETAINTFGLSRLSAKQTGFTFMAIATGMGMVLNTASDMSISLTALSAYMASFYNMSQSEASTALSSIFTGEIETLKRYGILITKVNLEEYARQQGITKSIEKMTQLEKSTVKIQLCHERDNVSTGRF